MATMARRGDIVGVWRVVAGDWVAMAVKSDLEGVGRFVDREEIERRTPGETTDLFTRMVGVDLVRDGCNPVERYVALRSGRQTSLTGRFDPCVPERCYPQVVVDGLIVHRSGRFPARVDHLVNTDALAGIEVYPGQAGVPAQYSGTSSTCGIVLFWTRR